MYVTHDHCSSPASKRAEDAPSIIRNRSCVSSVAGQCGHRSLILLHRRESCAMPFLGIALRCIPLRKRATSEIWDQFNDSPNHARQAEMVGRPSQLGYAMDGGPPENDLKLLRRFTTGGDASPGRQQSCLRNFYCSALPGRAGILTPWPRRRLSDASRLPMATRSSIHTESSWMKHWLSPGSLPHLRMMLSLPALYLLSH